MHRSVLCGFFFCNLDTALKRTGSKRLHAPSPRKVVSTCSFCQRLPVNEEEISHPDLLVNVFPGWPRVLQVTGTSRMMYTSCIYAWVQVPPEVMEKESSISLGRLNTARPRRHPSLWTTACTTRKGRGQKIYSRLARNSPYDLLDPVSGDTVLWFSLSLSLSPPPVYYFWSYFPPGNVGEMI